MNWMMEVFRRDPLLWEKYRDEANLYLYGAVETWRISLAVKEHRRRVRRWTFNGTHWFGKPFNS